jgi:hypothetical protein
MIWERRNGKMEDKIRKHETERERSNGKKTKNSGRV